MRKSLFSLAVAGTLATTLLSTAAVAQTATYALDPTHTFASFEIGHFGTSTNKGRFDKKEGSVQMDRTAKTGKLEVTIDTTSINSGTPAFDKHLQSADLFDTAKHPTIKFVSDKFVFSGDKVTEIVGNLTLLGKTQPVTLKATQFNCYQSPMLKREVCGGDFETTIDRTAFGMNYGVDWGFPKNVRLIVQAEGIKQ
ncbi:polyisoprenoid-binding protein [Rhodoferax sp. AJA081-3]|uniref:YceI family protein n=1 Tax=Rhodoferax sp. AJA081-3 TaxID=2752316 RepID=UPI001AE00DBA|nr:YceI family protein [Rhodoferax sp. AJA081-3]QTN26640.1 polyisoprenoid-binding protein [Rhodoferax sp. AJA081-3]